MPRGIPSASCLRCLKGFHQQGILQSYLEQGLTCMFWPSLSIPSTEEICWRKSVTRSFFWGNFCNFHTICKYQVIFVIYDLFQNYQVILVISALFQNCRVIFIIFVSRLAEFIDLNEDAPMPSQSPPTNLNEARIQDDEDEDDDFFGGAEKMS